MVNFSSFNPFGPSVKASTEIVDLRVYPIKSCRGISLKSTNLTRKGLDLDRNWMFMHKTNSKFMTIREISQLTLIDTALATPTSTSADSSEDDVELVISIRNKPGSCIRIPARPTQTWLEENAKLGDATIWGHTTDGWIYDEKYSQIFAEFLEHPIVLVYKGPTPRNLKGRASADVLGRQESVNFPDQLPVLIANEQSIKELNTRLEAKGSEKITIERFRPNIIVRGDEDQVDAWAEDKWKVVRVVNREPSNSWFGSTPSTLDIDAVQSCTRCLVPNVDPETAVKNKHEPWDTLITYRRIDPSSRYKPCFGMLCCPRNEGPIAVGMKLEVLELHP